MGLKKPPTEKRPPAPPDEAPTTPNRVWVSLERKYRVAEYESLSISLGAAGNLEPGEAHKDGLRRVFRELREEFYDVVEVMREAEKI